MKVKLKITFIESKTNELMTEIKMRVLFMDERFRRKTSVEECKEFTASNKFKIYSYESPALSNGHICLWGTSLDSFVAYKYININKVEAYIKSIKIALKDWAENWTGWNEN